MLIQLVRHLVTIGLVCVAVYRISRLLAVEEFPPIVGVRERIAGRWGSGSWQAYLSECPWCISVWTGAGVTAATALTVGLWLPLLVWPAASVFTGLVTSWEDR